MIESASAGVEIYRQASFPSFPALITQTIPTDAAQVAALAAMVIFPFRSEYL